MSPNTLLSLFSHHPFPPHVSSFDWNNGENKNENYSKSEMILSSYSPNPIAHKVLMGH
jgi:hypothetical protein